MLLYAIVKIVFMTAKIIASLDDDDDDDDDDDYYYYQ